MRWQRWGSAGAALTMVMAVASCALFEQNQDADPPSSGATTSAPRQDVESTSSAQADPTESDPTEEDTESESEPQIPEGAVLWQDNAAVSHLFFHSLIVDPERAFSDRESGAGYADYMITVDEFTAILEQLYDNDYVLISPHDLATVADDGTVSKRELWLPEGKKPLVISVDDVSYYEYMEGDGFASHLVIDDDGRVRASYTDAEGTTTVGAYDVMPIVDDFVAAHPDFSHDGARGVLALTGYNGVFGYRSSPSVYGDSETLDSDIYTASQVAKALKAEGWEFASHSWGHISFTDSDLAKITTDNERWKADVEPIIGATDLLIYPFGADISRMPPYEGEKYDYLRDQGFTFYFGVDGSTPAWGQWGDDYVRQARLNIDGLSLKAAIEDDRPVLQHFFDPESVLDPARPDSIAGS